MERDDWIDGAMSRREFLHVIEPYHLAMAEVTRCLITVTRAMKNSDIDELAAEGRVAYQNIDSVITSLESASKRLSALAKDAEVQDED